MINQERRKILEMVATGSLSIEQADQLLANPGPQNAAFVEKRLDEGQQVLGVTTFTREQMAALADYEVDADYIRALREAGLGDLTVKQLITLKNYEVDAEYIKALREVGFTKLTVEQLIALKNYDVDAEYVRALQKAGFNNLTVEQLIALKEIC